MNNLFNRFIAIKNYKKQIPNILTYLCYTNIRVNVELKFVNPKGSKVTYYLFDKSGTELINQLREDVKTLKFIKLTKAQKKRRFDKTEYEDLEEIRNIMVMIFFGVNVENLKNYFEITPDFLKDLLTTLLRINTNNSSNA